MKILQDNYGRSFSYLRLSLTDACNFSCRYCLPNGYEKLPFKGDPSEDKPLALFEIDNLVRGVADFGFKKIRLTGGEPTLRTDIVDIVRTIADIPGIQTVALTTNGYRLDKLARPLQMAGLSAINISLDSLDPARFAEITGCKRYQRVRAGVDQALASGIKKVKINVVLLKSYSERELPGFLDLVRLTPLAVRFIELMETGTNGDFFRKEHLSGDDFCAALMDRGWREIPRGTLDGPARELVHPEFTGRLGIIAPYSKDFCMNCNRLRVSSRGKLKLCLFGTGEYSLRKFLQSPAQRGDLLQALEELIGTKARGHRLHEGIFGSTQHLAGIGG